MAELRWVLLALGVLLVAGVYFWGRGGFGWGRLSSRERPRRRREPKISADGPVSDDVLFAAPGEEPEAEAGSRPASEAPSSASIDEHRSREWKANVPRGPEKIVALRFVPRSLELDATEAVAALQEAGLEHGRYGIFHYHVDSIPDEAQFSVASLTEPGSFDLDRLDEKPLAGMSFFMVLPGSGDPVQRFDAMVETARSLAHRLDAELFDDAGSSWSIQRERYIREELISYRLQAYPS